MPEFTASDPEPAFEFNENSSAMDVTDDGERILIATSVEQDGSVETRQRITVVLNWFDEIERRSRR